MSKLSIDAQKQNHFLISPEDIIVDYTRNSRAEPPAPEDVVARVRSFESLGQLQPVEVRKIAGGKVELTLGYTRYAAAVEYNKSHPDRPMKLKCSLIDCNNEEAFLRNIAENLERRDLTPLDQAHAQRKLRDEFGWADKKIADLYKISIPYVSTLKKLLSVPAHIRNLVKTGQCSAKAAGEMADLEPADQVEVIEELKQENPQLTQPTQVNTPSVVVSSQPLSEATPAPEQPKVNVTDKVMEKVRNKKIEKGGGSARTIKNILVYFTELSGPGQPEPLQRLSSDVIKFVKGQIKDETMTKKLNDLLGIKETEAHKE